MALHIGPYEQLPGQWVMADHFRPRNVPTLRCHHPVHALHRHLPLSVTASVASIGLPHADVGVCGDRIPDLSLHGLAVRGYHRQLLCRPFSPSCELGSQWPTAVRHHASRCGVSRHADAFGSPRRGVHPRPVLGPGRHPCEASQRCRKVCLGPLCHPRRPRLWDNDLCYPPTPFQAQAPSISYTDLWGAGGMRPPLTPPLTPFTPPCESKATRST
mmetsp:Transcript_111316/g.193188  ORF Transcript_111316/g.193188 Transcript_111316/m.193188 type:complete len:215 (+) Transcript_111316:323-967(+)